MQFVFIICISLLVFSTSTVLVPHSGKPVNCQCGNLPISHYCGYDLINHATANSKSSDCIYHGRYKCYGLVLDGTLKEEKAAEMGLCNKRTCTHQTPISSGLIQCTDSSYVSKISYNLNYTCFSPNQSLHTRQVCPSLCRNNNILPNCLVDLKFSKLV